jgi:hypothetical protein
MTAAEDIQNEKDEQLRQKEPQRRVEWNADTGEGLIETGRVADGFDPNNLDDVLTHHGLDPQKWRIVGHVGFTEWDIPFRTNDGRRLFHKAQSHKFRIEPRFWCVDLPALYAEIANTPKPKKHRKDSPGDSTMVVGWSDVQTGKVDHLGGVKELLERLDDKRRALEAHLNRSSFDRIIVADAGDIIEGFGNFPAQHRTNGLSLMEQVDVATTELWKTVRLCSKFAPVDLLSVTSNHCAWRREGKNLAGKPTDDWGLHINQNLEWHNSLAADGPELPISFHRCKEWEETLQFATRGHKIGMAHGHQASNPDQVKTWWAKMTHAGVLDCNILLTGHYHFFSVRPVGKDPLTGKSRWHIQLPTLDNGSAWVRNKYGEDGDPALCVFQIDDDGFNLQSLALL